MATCNLQQNNATTRPLVLLVEDDLIVQKVNRILLEKSGCQVNAVKTGAEALAQINEQYDLVFMDLGLPDMTGYEATTQIRQKLGAKRIPIIVLTAFDVGEVEEKCLSVGVNEVFSKTLPLDNFKNILERYLNQRVKN
jgi:CheY-like chemotaxis protein